MPLPPLARSHLRSAACAVLSGLVIPLVACASAGTDGEPVSAETERSPSTGSTMSPSTGSTMSPSTGSSSSPSSGTTSSPPTGTTAPAPDVTVPPQLDFTAPTLDGGTFDGASLAGTPAVVWFWAPWCPVCRREAGLIADLAAQYEGRVSFVGVAGLSGDRDAMESFVAETGVDDIPHIDDRDGAIYARFGVTQQYDLGVVTASGEVDVIRGPLDEEAIVAKVEQLAAG